MKILKVFGTIALELGGFLVGLALAAVILGAVLFVMQAVPALSDPYVGVLAGVVLALLSAAILAFCRIFKIDL